MDNDAPSGPPLRWSELGRLPGNRALNAYLRGLREYQRSNEINFLITEAHSPETWRDTHGGLLPEPPGPRLLIAALRPEPEHAREEAARFDLPAGVPGPGDFESPRAFLEAWLDFLEREPPDTLVEFLRMSFFMTADKARETAREITEGLLHDTIPFSAAFKALEDPGLWRVFAPPMEKRKGEYVAPTSHATFAFLAGEREAYKWTRFSGPRFLVLLLVPGFIAAVLSSFSRSVADTIGMSLTMIGLLLIVFSVARNAYSRFRERLIEAVIMEDVPSTAVISAFRSEGTYYPGLESHSFRMARDPFVKYADGLRRMIMRDPV